MTNNRVLIVSYKLGTDEGVGGRRWLVYGLELLKNGYDVHFLSCQKKLPEELTKHQNRVYVLKSNYPSVLKSIPKTILNKIRYRFWIRVLNLINKGSIFDEAARIEAPFMDLASKIISNKKINTLIVSGAPFSLLHYGTLLKKKFPDIKLIVDYRDGWTEGTGYGIRNLPAEKFKYELEREKNVLSISDCVFVASMDIQNQLKHIDSNKETHVLPNFVDVKQYEDNVDLTERKPNPEIVVTHIGSVNVNIEKYWKHFFKHLLLLNEEKIPVRVQFVGNVNKDLEVYVAKENIPHVTFLPRASKKELAGYMNASHFLLFFKHDEFPDSFPTKFFDYVVFRKPLICYTKSGSVSEEIISNKLGCVLTDATSKEDFLNIFLQYLNGTLSFNKHYDWSKYSLETCVKAIEKQLQ